MTLLSIFLQLILWVSLVLLGYSYVVFPRLIKWLSKKAKGEREAFERGEDLPGVSILMSLYNEEKVILEKLKTLAAQQFPTQKLDVYIGSDCSSDRTNAIVSQFIATNELAHFHFFPFEERQGKPGVINQLVERAIERKGRGQQHVLIITDASVLLEPNTVFQLVRHFKRPEIGLVDANMQHVGLQKAGISKSEDAYISGEVSIKYWESQLNGKMMGPFGGCYAIRSDLFIPVPSNYLVDDFYLAMNVLDQGKDAINDLNAICLESVSHEIKEEYRRKRRISAGNFQNLSTYRHLLYPSKGPIAFNFWSHKVLRWLGPFFILLSLISNILLSLLGIPFYTYLLLAQLALIFGLPLLDILFQSLQIHIAPLRSIRYFFLMNLALLEGYIKYRKGVKTNIWQPTKRAV